MIPEKVSPKVSPRLQHYINVYFIHLQPFVEKWMLQPVLEVIKKSNDSVVYQMSRLQKNKSLEKY